jgi:hypothetical protein
MLISFVSFFNELDIERKTMFAVSIAFCNDFDTERTNMIVGS